jgi:O-antigen/teichoic acid export membrane protein
MTGSASADRRTIVRNAAANWLAFAVQIAVAFFLSPVLVHRLQERRYGIWSLVESVLAYLVLLDLGVAASIVRYVARFEATRDYDRVNRVFSASICIFAVAGLVAQGIALGIAALGLPLFHIPGDLLQEARWLLILLGLNFGLGLPLNVFPCVLDGLGRYPAKSGIRTISLLIRSGILLGVVLNGGGLIALGIVITGCTIVENAVMAVAAKYYLPSLRFSFGLIDRETLRMIRSYTAEAFLAMLAGRISFQTDAIVIGLFLPPEQITFFAIAGRLVEYSKESLRAMTTVLTPAVSVLEARGDMGGVRKLFMNSTRYALWLILPVQAGLMTLGRPFLGRWMGPQFAELSFPVLLILATPLGLAMSQSVSARILFGTSRLTWYARALIVEAVANAFLSVLLAKPLGIEGVALGTAIPNVCLNVALIGYICRMMEVSPARYVVQSFARPLGCALVLGVGWQLCVWSFALTTWPAILGVGAVGLALYGALALAIEGGLRRIPAFIQRRDASTEPATIGNEV